MVAALADLETPHFNFNDAAMESHAQDALRPPWSPLEIVALPTPAPVVHQGERL